MLSYNRGECLLVSIKKTRIFGELSNVSVTLYVSFAGTKT